MTYIAKAMDTNVVIVYENLQIICKKNDSLLKLSDYNDYVLFRTDTNVSLI